MGEDLGATTSPSPLAPALPPHACPDCALGPSQRGDAEPSSMVPATHYRGRPGMVCRNHQARYSLHGTSVATTAAQSSKTPPTIQEQNCGTMSVISGHTCQAWHGSPKRGFQALQPAERTVKLTEFPRTSIHNVGHVRIQLALFICPKRFSAQGQIFRAALARRV